jgi:hypothetical protein
MFGVLIKQLKSPINCKKLWNIYMDLERWDVMIFNYTDDGIKINILFGTPTDGVYRESLI